MLEAVCERTSYPGLESRLIVGNEAAPRQPGLVQPVDRARLELDPTAQDHLRHAHRRELEAADLARGLDVVDHERDVVPAILEGDDLGFLPHVAEPLTVREPALDRPCEKPFNGRLRGTLAIRIEYADVCDGSCRQVAELNLEAVGVLASRQRRETTPPS